VSRSRHDFKPKTAWRKFRYQLEFLVSQLGFILVPLIPRSCVYPLAQFLGTVAFKCIRRDRELALTNLRFVYGTEKSEQEIFALALKSMRNFALVIIDSLWCRNLKNSNIDQYVTFDPIGLALYDRLVAEGKGVILIGMHHGNWEWMSLGIGFKGRPVNIVVQEMRNRKINDAFNVVRTRAGHRLLYRESPALALKLFKALKKGETLGLLTDLNAKEHEGAIAVDFMGKKIHANSAPALLALRTGAAIVMMTTYWEDGKYQTHFGPIMPTDFEGAEDEKIKAITQHWLNVFETTIRDRPERWLWSYKRFKYRPTEELEGYPEYSRYSPILGRGNKK